MDIEKKEQQNLILKNKKHIITYVDDVAFDGLADGEIYKLMCNATYFKLTNKQYTYRNSEVLEYKAWLLVWGFNGEILQYILENSKETEAFKWMNFNNHLKIKIKERFNFNHLYDQLLRQIDNMGQFEMFLPRFKKIENEIYKENPDKFKLWCAMTNEMCYEKLKNKNFNSKFSRFVNALEDTSSVSLDVYLS